MRAAQGAVSYRIPTGLAVVLVSHVQDRLPLNLTRGRLPRPPPALLPLSPPAPYSTLQKFLPSAQIVDFARAKKAASVELAELQERLETAAAEVRLRLGARRGRGGDFLGAAQTP